ncbi:DUF3048 domain-containing protein [Bacillus licheniformis]|nr:DUF3048 domain-containing protein [Bacillus licheniformis]
MVNRYVRVLLVCFALLLASCQSQEQQERKEHSSADRVEGGRRYSAAAHCRCGEQSFKARPQSGLSKADIVIEALSEGPITRLLAIYQSDMPEAVGPVRSAREYFIDLALGLTASLCITAGVRGKDRLLNGDADHINGMDHDGTLFGEPISGSAA